MIEDKIKCFCVNALPASDYVRNKTKTQYEYLCHYIKREGCKYSHREKDHDFCSVNKHLILFSSEGNEI